MNERPIYYIDDDKDDLEIFQVAVDQVDMSLKLHTHTNASQFLQTLRTECAHNPLVFLDINMPERSGFDLLKDIRKTVECKDVPVIMLSTSDDPQAMTVSRDLGASRYVVKPNTISELKDIIRQVAAIEWKDGSVYQQNFVINA